MRALSLLFFTLLAGPVFAQETGAPIGCKEDNADCKENCTVEYGSSSRTYAQLGSCLQKCKQTYDKCAERHFALAIGSARRRLFVTNSYFVPGPDFCDMLAAAAKRRFGVALPYDCQMSWEIRQLRPMCTGCRSPVFMSA